MWTLENLPLGCLIIYGNEEAFRALSRYFDNGGLFPKIGKFLASTVFGNEIPGVSCLILNYT